MIRKKEQFLETIQQTTTTKTVRAHQLEYNENQIAHQPQAQAKTPPVLGIIFLLIVGMGFGLSIGKSHSNQKVADIAFAPRESGADIKVRAEKKKPKKIVENSSRSEQDQIIIDRVRLGFKNGEYTK